ncbi:MAG TPA: aminotransferase class V-fold PLP-dependent enzyme [Candidatus Sulfotelmatobacter sp.]|jgi:L-seryl-tRNA(Ser) seleniumtransferase|nr:aminotransferase class V-fold PLP-dependent enzyme [Candidatus Sulfotelmatobacter sp.]
MRAFNTRRNFFGSIAKALAGGTILRALPLRANAATTQPSGEGEDYYAKLGVTKIINAAGTYTLLTASTMPPSVQAAVAQAAKHPVHLAHLQRAAGEYLARKLRCEAAMVTAGAASAVTLGTAACITLGNESASHAIPTDMAGLKNEVVVQKAHRYDYDHALRNCGIRFVEVQTLQEYDSAINKNTAMCFFYNAADEGSIGREDWIRVAHAHGVPCLNDAAADVPPISNLWNYTQMGFDLVAFSGGKGIRGPQNAGLLLGRKDLIAAAVENNSPNDDVVGRGMKVAKEQIVGMVAAIDWFLSQSDAGIEAELRKRIDRITGELKDIPTLKSETFIPPVANHVPHLLIRYDQERVKISIREVAKQLRQGTPSIELNPATGSTEGSAGIPRDPNKIVVGVWMLEPGEDSIVAHRLRDVLTKAATMTS